jgi:hypothetical protein
VAISEQFEQHAPAYEFGSTCAANPRFKDRDFAAIEPELRGDWEARGEGAWETCKGSSYGWDKMRGRRAA